MQVEVAMLKCVYLGIAQLELVLVHACLSRVDIPELSSMHASVHACMHAPLVSPSQITIYTAIPVNVIVIPTDPCRRGIFRTVRFGLVWSFSLDFTPAELLQHTWIQVDTWIHLNKLSSNRVIDTVCFGGEKIHGC